MPKIVERYDQPEFVRWVRANLPDSLQLVHQNDGYGDTYKIKPSGWTGRMSRTIARIDPSRSISRGPVITLLQNLYFSDMELLAIAYEKQFGATVMIEYWPGESKVPPPKVQGGRAVDD